MLAKPRFKGTHRSTIDKSSEEEGSSTAWFWIVLLVLLLAYIVLRFR